MSMPRQTYQQHYDAGRLTLLFLVLYLMVSPACISAQRPPETIFDALRNGKLDKVKTLLAKTRKLEARDSNGNTILIVASGNGHLSIVQYLLAQRARVNADNQGYTALIAAAAGGYTDIVKLLLAKGAKVNNQDVDGRTALLSAARGDRVNPERGYELVQALLAHRADPNRQNDHGQTALMLASMYRQTEITRLLLSKNAALDVQDREGNTALILAVASRVYRTHSGPLLPYLPMIQMLIDKGANVHIKNRAGQTALMIAIKDEYVEIAKILTKADERK
jgi:ankyrin repeat protein